MLHACAAPAEFVLHGVPSDLEGATTLHREKPSEFAKWAVSLVGAHPEDPFPGNAGCNGRIHFVVDNDISAPEALLTCFVAVNSSDSVLDSIGGLLEATD